jgi:cathepsin L
MFNLRCEINEFGDLTLEEYRNILMPAVERQKYYDNDPAKLSRKLPKKLSQKLVPDSFDWRMLNGVTNVKNQQKCASCWSFSAAGAIETQLFRLTGKLVSLSEQQMMDCSASYGNKGCHKGAMTFAFKYIKENGGLVPEEIYPYEAKVEF